jgi:tail-anchored protein insertion receptor
MMLLLSTLFICILHYIFQTIGWNYFGTLVYRNFTTTRKEIQSLKKQIIATKTEILNTSAQDQFAKWAKLRRQHDKLMAKYTELSSSYSSLQMQFSTLTGWVLYVALWSCQVVILVWYSSTPVFYLPEDWFGPLTSWLKFPFAPVGSVGVFYWWSAIYAFLDRIGKLAGALRRRLAFKVVAE